MHHATMMAEKLVVYMANSMLQISDISSKLKAKSYKKKIKGNNKLPNSENKDNNYMTVARNEEEQFYNNA